MRSQRFSCPGKSLLVGLAVLVLACGCGKDSNTSVNPPDKKGTKVESAPTDQEKAAEALNAFAWKVLGGELSVYEERVKLPEGEYTVRRGPSIQVESAVEGGAGKGPLVGTVTFHLQGTSTDSALTEKTQPYLDVSARYVLKEGRWTFEAAAYTLTESVGPAAPEAEGKERSVDRTSFPQLFELLSKQAPG